MEEETKNEWQETECQKCLSINSIRYDKQEICLADKNSTCVDIMFHYCDECGNVTDLQLFG